MNGGRPVRPQRGDDGREMCEVDEEGGDAFGYKADRDGDDHEGVAEEEGLIQKMKKVVTKPTRKHAASESRKP